MFLVTVNKEYFLTMSQEMRVKEGDWKVSDTYSHMSDIIMFIIHVCRLPTRSNRCRDELRRESEDA